MNSPSKKIMWGGREIQVYGPYIVPVAVDRVWIHQLSEVTLPGDLVQQIIVGASVLSVGRCEKPLKTVGRIVLNKHSFVDVVVVWNGQKLRTRALMDTGASLNVMTAMTGHLRCKRG